MIEIERGSCEMFQRVAHAWLRSGEITRTNHMLSPLEELAGYNYGFVYLLEVQGDPHDPPSFKIGFSEHPMRRIREIRATYRYGRDLKLRACFVGEQERERELHRRFSHLRIQNERFFASPVIETVFANERERMKKRLSDLHLCTTECEQVVKGLDLRMLRAWLR